MLLTVRWGQLKPSQPSRRVARRGQIRPSQRHPAASQVGPLQAALPAPNQVVTATSQSPSPAASPTLHPDVVIDMSCFTRSPPINSSRPRGRVELLIHCKSAEIVLARA